MGETMSILNTKCNASDTANKSDTSSTIRTVAVIVLVLMIIGGAIFGYIYYKKKKQKATKDMQHIGIEEEEDAEVVNEKVEKVKNRVNSIMREIEESEAVNEEEEYDMVTRDRSSLSQQEFTRERSSHPEIEEFTRIRR